MQTVTLSDHPGAKVQELAHARHVDFDNQSRAYSYQMQMRTDRSQALRSAGQSALRRGRLFKWAGVQLQRIAHAASEAPALPVMAAPRPQEAAWAAGERGETIVCETLARRLDDQWTLLRGYKNRGGEADVVLVGPEGVVAIEVKYMTGTISCAGGRWWRDKFDRFGNLVQRAVPIQDRRGRSPSDQINAVADGLEAFLRGRCGVRRVHRVVVLSHENARLGQTSDVAVDRILTMAALEPANLFPAHTSELANPREVAALIAGDHDFQQRRRDAHSAGAAVYAPKRDVQGPACEPPRRRPVAAAKPSEGRARRRPRAPQCEIRFVPVVF